LTRWKSFALLVWTVVIGIIAAHAIDYLVPPGYDGPHWNAALRIGAVLLALVLFTGWASVYFTNGHDA